MSDFPCRLYLSLTGDCPPAELTGVLNVALRTDAIAAVLYSPNSPSQNPDLMQNLMAQALSHEAAFIIADDIALAQSSNADGVHLFQGAALFDTAKKTLNIDSVIGVSSALNRHDAMVTGETGADYILFDANTDPSAPNTDAQTLENLISWWAEMFEIPSVAHAHIDIEQNRTLINAGVDFLCVTPNVTKNTSPTNEFIASLNELIADCGRSK